MAFLNTKERYGSLSIALHWLMVVLLIAIYACGELHGFFPKGGEIRKGLMSWHFFLGITVFILVAVRLVARWMAPEPRVVPDIGIWQKRLARVMHWALYLLMIGMPILGYLGMVAVGKPVYFLGMELPMLMETDKPLGKAILETHETIGAIGYFLIGLHALAALFHHYVQRDNTLTRMLFTRK